MDLHAGIAYIKRVARTQDSGGSQIKQKSPRSGGGARAAPRRGVARIGTSGWQYKHWKGTFYPGRLADRDALDFYFARFDTVEVNNSFYRLPSRETFEGWKRRTPPGFLFAVKGSRYLTHMKKLGDPEAGIAEFFGAARGLGRKLGPVLFQLPPFWKLNLERLDAFLSALPPRGRYAFEFRNATWHVPEVLEVLRRHGAAWCIYELAGFVSPMEVTAGFAYVRLHGPGKEKYQGSYPPETLEAWAARIRAWTARGIDVYLYFDNDMLGYAPANAAALRALLNGERKPAKEAPKPPEKGGKMRVWAGSQPRGK
jgi:uncharacterized protein YecE (DUF72 family)